ncbi:MAG: hypothetical protein R3D02_11080 [Hyphomicrobiales bacterium]
MIERREFLVAGGKAVAFVVLAGVAGCNSEEKTGPVAVKFGRDGCDYCRMIISDPRFAAQIRGGPKHKTFNFDDIGDAVLFLDEQPWKDDADVEFFVMDVETGKTWLDARAAYFLTDQVSPMAFGFGAVADARPGAVTFAEMSKRVVVAGSPHLCNHDPADVAQGEQR